MSTLHELSASQLRAGYLNCAFSPVEVLEALADRISRTEPTVNSFTTVVLDEAMAAATLAEAAYAAGHARTFEGIPFAVKDLMDTRGIRSTYGSAMFRDHVPRRDADAVARLLGAGGILVGKTATHEFAWGITSVNGAMGSPHNPWDLARIADGSSGGSAAAVAALEVPVALGTDTGGSIRIPAAFCGIMGFKPTFGLISTEGVFPLSPSLDHVGLMTRDPADLPGLLQVLAGQESSGTATEARPAVDREVVNGALTALRLGVCRDLRPVRLSNPTMRAFDAAIQTWEALGARVLEVRFPEAGAIDRAFAWTQQAEALDTHTTRNLFPARESEYGPDVRARLQAASTVTLSMYLEAQRLRDSIRAGFRRLFDDVDVLLGPIAPMPPPAPGADVIRHFGHQRTLRELVMPFVVPQDLAGLPAVAIRAGFDPGGLPIGLQLSGPPGSDYRVLEMARQFHGATASLQSTWPVLGPERSTARTS